MTLPVVPKALGTFKSQYLPEGKSIEFQPFTIGQESIMLAVKDEDSKPEDRLQAIKQVVQECVKNPNYPVGKIATFLLQLLFLRIYQKSVGEYVEIGFTCKHQIKTEDGSVECNQSLPIKIDLREVDLKTFEGHDTKVMLTDTIGVKFQYPNIDMALEASGEDKEVDTLLACMDFIFDGDEITYVKDVDVSELLAWYKDLDIAEKRKMMVTFLGTMPTLYYEKEEVCPKCGTKHKIQFTELEDFFD